METQGKQVYVDAATLFDYGFDHFKKVDIGQNAGGSTTALIHARTGGVESGTPAAAEIPVQLEGEGYVILPDEVAVSQLEPDLYYDTENASEGSLATLEYSFGGRTVGSAQILLPASLIIPEEPETAEEPSLEEEPQRKKGSGFRWLYAVLGILAAAALAGGGYLFIRRQIWKFRWRRRRYGGRDQVYRRHVRRNNVYHIQARRRRWWRR